MALFNITLTGSEVEIDFKASNQKVKVSNQQIEISQLQIQDI